MSFFHFHSKKPHPWPHCSLFLPRTPFKAFSRSKCSAWPLSAAKNMQHQQCALLAEQGSQLFDRKKTWSFIISVRETLISSRQSNNLLLYLVQHLLHTRCVFDYSVYFHLSEDYIIMCYTQYNIVYKICSSSPKKSIKASHLRSWNRIIFYIFFWGMTQKVGKISTMIATNYYVLAV